MPYWRPLRVGEELYELSHLEPFSFLVTPAGHSKEIIVVVRFHDHCFTESFDPEKHKHAAISNNSSRQEKRGFCQERYKLNKELPNFIKGLNGKRVRQTRKGDLVRVELENGRKYGIFFTLSKSSPKSCNLFVLSAYPFENEKKIVSETGEMKFNVALALIWKGQRPKFPPRN